MDKSLYSISRLGLNAERQLRSVLLGVLLSLWTASCAPAVGPASPAGPRFPEYPVLDVPSSLGADARMRADLMEAWSRLQAGEIGRAKSLGQTLLKQRPSFYPAEALLGFVELASRHPKPASDRFSAVIAHADRYLPAWLGLAEANLALGRDADAIEALERVLMLDPKRETVRARLELVRLRLVQTMIEAGRQARLAGRFDQARQLLSDALTRAPSSGLILQELVLVEREAGQLSAAEALARRAVQVEPDVADHHAVLGSLLAERGQFADAAASYERALALDQRDEWRQTVAELREKARTAALPAEFAAISRSERVTRGQVAAAIGVRLAPLLARAPARQPEVATDIRRHWAAAWIVQVTRAGVMTIFPNHTFAPAAVVSRASLASTTAELVRLAAARSASLTEWQAARPRFPDLPPSHASYRSAALAVASGVMSSNTRGEFEPSRPVSGAELELALRRVERLASR